MNEEEITEQNDESNDYVQDTKTMSFLEHLDELRRRLFYCIISIFVAFIICWIYSKQIFMIVVAPAIRYLTHGQQLSFFSIPEPFLLYMKVAFFAALFLDSPFILTQLWSFISPGLYPKEKIYAIPFVVFTSFFFIAGGVFAYYVIFPLTCRFLLSYGEGFNAVLRITDYFSFFSKVILGVGLTFEMPMLAFFLGKLKIITPKFLWRNFGYAVLIIFIIAAVVTPSTDAVTQTVLAVPMVALYLISILVVWVTNK